MDPRHPAVPTKSEKKGGKRSWGRGISEKVQDVRISARRERARRLASSPAAAIMSRRESRILERLIEAARDVTTARTTNGIQTRQRVHRMRRTAMPRTVMEMAERSVVA